MNRLLALFGLDRRLRQVRVAAGEAALAAEDRAQLLKLAWDEERERLRMVLTLVVAVAGLTTVAVALLSMAVVVHYWETPHRTAAAWWVAGAWVVLWLLALVMLLKQLRTGTAAKEALTQEIERDWHWVQSQIGARPRDPALRAPRPRSRDELLSRIARQRERIATLQHPPPGSGAAAKSAAAAPAKPQDWRALVTGAAREHPVATAAVVTAVAAAVGPRRLLRVATWALPVLWKLR